MRTWLPSISHRDQIIQLVDRFLVVVWAVYRQMKTQNAPILSEIDEDNFDRAFDFLRPGMCSVL